MTAALAALAAAMATLLAVASLTGVFSPDRRRLHERAVALERAGTGPLQGTSGALRDDTLSGNPRANAFLRRFSWSGQTAKLLERADLPLKVGEYLLIQLATFAVVGLLVFLISDYIAIGVIVGASAALALRIWVGNRAKKRLAAFNKQLPSALSVMSTSLRSGFSIMESVRAVAREMDKPLSQEFSRILDETRVGGSFEDSVNRMVDRVQSADLKMVAHALDIHRRVGGDLAAILESVAFTMREREELRGHVMALTAQQRFGGMIVGLLPVWVVGFFAVTEPEFISPLWEENIGRVILAVAVVMEAIAFFAVRLVLKVDV